MSMSPEMHKVACRDWVADSQTDYDSLPVDLTTDPVGGCDARSQDGYFCTRADDHGGRHAAGDSYRIVAVWGGR